MKKTLAAVLFIMSFSVFAQTMIYPQVFNTGFGAQVQTHNNTNHDFSCNGWVYLQGQTGMSESHFHSDFVFRNGFSFRTYQLRNWNDRVLWVNHSIFCNPVN